MKRLAFLLVLAGIIAGTFFWQRHQDTLEIQEKAFQADKLAFAQLEGRMQRGYDAMLTEAGKPQDDKLTKDCSHVSLKLKAGQLTCSVQYQLVYGVDDITKAADITTQLNRALDGQGYHLKPSSPNLDDIDTDSNKQQIVRLEYDEPGQANCELAFGFNPASLSRYQEAKISQPYVADYAFKCLRNATKPIYTLAQ